MSNAGPPAAQIGTQLAATLFVMPLYHFKLVGPDSAYSLEGAFLQDDVQADKVARGLAYELRWPNPELLAEGFEIVFTREDVDEIGRVSIDPVP